MTTGLQSRLDERRQFEDKQATAVAKSCRQRHPEFQQNVGIALPWALVAVVGDDDVSF